MKYILVYLSLGLIIACLVNIFNKKQHDKDILEIERLYVFDGINISKTTIRIISIIFITFLWPWELFIITMNKYNE